MIRLPALLSLAAGACSLSFQILWARSLACEVGSPLATFTLVVCTFMLGLAGGAIALGWAADRTGTPLRLFGATQMVSGALILAAAWMVAGGGAVRPLIRSLEAAPGTPSFVAVEILVGGGITLLPALAMGGSLPTLLRACGGRADGGAVGALAAAGATGAAAGSLLCAFGLLPVLGLWRSLAAVGGGCVLVGIAAIVAPRDAASAARGRMPEDAAEPAGGLRGSGLPAGAWRILAALLLCGLAVTALEIVWTRLAYLALGSSVQAGSLVVSAVICGLALGNAAAGTRPVATSSLSLVVCGAAFAVLATDPLLGRLPAVAFALQGWLIPSDDASGSAALAMLIQFVLMFLVAAGPCFLLGAAFPVGCAALRRGRGAAPPDLERDGGLVGVASAALSAGYLLGAPLAYLGVIGLAGSRGCLLTATVILALASLLCVTGPAKGRKSLAPPVAAFTALGLCVITGALLPWDPDLLSSGPFLYGRLYAGEADSHHAGRILQALRERGDLVFAREGADALVTVRRSRDGLLSMQVNGKTDASTGGDMKTQMLTTHLPLLLHARRPDPPRRALLVGLGSGVSAAAALAHPLEALDVLEISPQVVEASRLFDLSPRSALTDSRARVIVGDARTFMMFGTQDPMWGRFDVIASQPSNPWIAGQSLLFTREFFAEAHRRLAPGGLMSQWVQGYGLEPDDFRSVVATFASVFPHVSLWEESTAGGDYLLIGSNEPVQIDRPDLEEAMARPEIRQDLNRIEIAGPADLLEHFVADDAGVRRFAAHARLLTEDRLTLEFTAPLSLHRDTLGGLIRALEPCRSSPATLVPPGDPVAADLTRRARAARKERLWVEGLGLLGPPRAGDAQLVRAISYLRAGMRDHALQTLQAVSLRRPSDRLPRLMLAYLYLSATGGGQIDRAVVELRAAAGLDPDDASGHLYLARAYFAGGRIEDALSANLAALKLDPGQAEAYSDRCAMLLAAGDTASAEAACLDAIARDSELAEAHANLGVAQSRRGRVDQAERSYRRALELDDGLLDARFNLASLLERQDRPREGLAALTPALVTPGDADAAALRLAARLALGAGDAGAARGYLARSLELEPEDAEAREIERRIP